MIKTTLCSIVSDYLKEKYPNRKVLSVFLPIKSDEQSTIEGGILRQLLPLHMNIDTLPKEIETMFENFRKNIQLDNAQTRNLVQTLSNKYDRVYVIVDGVDDEESNENSLVKKYLAELMQNKNISVFTTSLDYEQIDRIQYCDVCKRTNVRVTFSCDIDQYDVCLECNPEITECPQGHELKGHPYTSVHLHYRVEQEVIRECVRRWLHDPLMDEQLEINGMLDVNSYRDRLALLFHRQKDAEDKFVLEVSEKVQGNLRLARRWVEALKKVPYGDERWRILYRCPSDELKEIYKDSLQRVVHHELKHTRTLGLIALALLTAAPRRITLRQLYEAIAAVMGPTRMKTAFDINLRGILKDLVVFSNGNEIKGDVWLRDGVLKIYLMENFIHDIEWSQEARSYFLNPHLAMAEACLRLLESCEESKVNDTEEGPTFLSYVLETWGDHVRLSLQEHCDRFGELDEIYKNTDSQQQGTEHRDLQPGVDSFFRGLQSFTPKLFRHWFHRDVSSLEQSPEQRNIQLRVDRILRDPQSFSAYMHKLEESNSVPSSIRQWIHRDVSPLHVCAWFGMSTSIKNLAATIDVNILENRGGHTPLMYAAMKSHLAVVNELLGLGAKIEIASNSGYTALLASIRGVNDSEDDEERRVEVYERLCQIMKLGANDIVDSRWCRTALMVAAAEDQPYIVASILEDQTVDINKQDLRGFTALLNAIYQNPEPFRIAKALLNQRDSELGLDLTDKLGRNALTLSIERIFDDEECCKFANLLLEKGANPTLNDHSGRSALTWATTKNQLRTLDLLLRHPTIKRDSIKAPILWASEHGCHEAIRLLCKFSRQKFGDVPGLNDGDETFKFTALHRACLCEKTDTVQVTLEVLLEFGADPNVVDKQGMTAFDIAKFFDVKPAMKALEGTAPDRISTTAVPPLILAKMGRWDLVEIAIRDTSVDTKDRLNWTGDTLLHFAVKTRKLEIVQQLLSSLHMRIDETNFDCRTPLHLAAGMKNDNIELVQLLFENGVSNSSAINAIDWIGCTPLDLAKGKKNLQTVEYLLKVGAKSGKEKRQHLSNFSDDQPITIDWRYLAWS